MVRPTGDESRQVPIAEVKPGNWSNSTDISPKDDTVTLTKSQFQQILEAISQTTVISGSENHFDSQENSENFSLKGNEENSNSDLELKENLYGNENVPEASTETTNKLQVPCPLDVISCPTSLSWSAPQSEVSPSKLSPLSKVEQKRLQWEREKAEMLEWNPWGKPGAGAPVKKTQIVSPITPRASGQLLMVHTSGAMPFTSSVPSSIPSCLPSPNCRTVPNNTDHNTFLPNKSFVNYSCIAQPVKPVPPVFKSSIAFGNTDSESITSEFYRRQQWLREIEEQRRFQEQIQMSQMQDSNWSNKEETESISVSIDGSVLPGAADASKRTYMRGQGFQLDPVSAALAEERRMKAQEYQQAIRLQMEEKQQRLEMERERKKLEEEAEEKRLQAERARIQADYEEEQLRIKQKAEMEEKKHQALVSAVQQAQLQAEMEKKSRKVQKLHPMNSENQNIDSSNIQTHSENTDVVSLTNNMESKLRITQNLEDPSCVDSSHKDDDLIQNETSCDPSNKKDLGIQTVPISDSEKSSIYVVDRVLTPSIFRVRARGGCGKDFGTQTDIHYGKYPVEDAESTESNTSSFHSPVAKRIVRVQHSKPYKAQRRPLCNDSIPVNERPKWGVNQPSKSYVRMTDRDPHFTKRKRMQELRKQHWARELAAQKSTDSSHQPIAPYSNLRGRRVASSSDCTLGYSSSEFETRSYRQIRSNSTPRYQQPSGFRSDCGSAETIAYFNYSPSAHANHLSQSYLQRRDSISSDNLPSIIGGSEPSPTRHAERFSIPSCGGGSLPPMRRKWHSQEIFHPSSNCHVFSPPHVPGVYPRLLCRPFHCNLPPPVAPQRRKWSDQESFDLESVVRSRVADGSRASSAESTEKSDAASVSSATSSAKSKSSVQNPLVCPEVVTGRPTPRQDRILQNLSSLRQGLLKKQKELESLIRRPPPFYS